MSVLDDQPVIEASLGGRVDRSEMKIFAEELEEFFSEYEGQPFYLLLDYSKASAFDAATTQTLNQIKDLAFASGANKIVSVPHETDELHEHVAGRIQDVLEGKEEFVAFAHQAEFAPIYTQYIALAA